MMHIEIVATITHDDEPDVRDGAYANRVAPLEYRWSATSNRTLGDVYKRLQRAMRLLVSRL